MYLYFPHLTGDIIWPAHYQVCQRDMVSWLSRYREHCACSGNYRNFAPSSLISSKGDQQLPTLDKDHWTSNIMAPNQKSFQETLDQMAKSAALDQLTKDLQTAEDSLAYEIHKAAVSINARAFLLGHANSTYDTYRNPGMTVRNNRC